MNVMGPIVGMLYDNYGPRYLLIGGSLLHVFGLMMASLGDKYYQLLLAQGVCSAIGVSAVFQPCMSWVLVSSPRGPCRGLPAARFCPLF